MFRSMPFRRLNRQTRPNVVLRSPRNAGSGARPDSTSPLPTLHAALHSSTHVHHVPVVIGIFAAAFFLFTFSSPAYVHPGWLLLLQRHLNCHEDVEALSHSSDADDTGSGLSTCLCLCSLLLSLSLLTPNFVFAFFGLKPISMDLALIVNRVMEEFLGSTAILLDSNTLTGTKKHQIPRVRIIHRIVVVGLRCKLQFAKGIAVIALHGNERGLEADGALGIQISIGKIRVLSQASIRAKLSKLLQQVAQSHWL
mmetsp:Transcript_33134/g.71425  ORF Transcript_33134/g.71425 Transcript_33134/m.71425 type:complete len:253 (+) Transcript_33134:452-1210(+)